MSAEVEFEQENVHSLLEPLIKDKTAGSHSSLALQDLTTVVSHLRRFGAKEQVGFWNYKTSTYVTDKIFGNHLEILKNQLHH